MIKLAGNIATTLRNQPLVLALIVVNLIFIAAGLYVLNRVATNATEWRETLKAMVDCRQK